MRFSCTFPLTLTLALVSIVLASIQGPDLEARVVGTPTVKEPGFPSPRMNDDDNNFNVEKRKLATDPYTVPYPEQTGPTRYAPLAKKPGTAIATTAPTPQFSASQYKIATEYMKPGTVLTTLTAPESKPITMMENTASPAPHP
ncbi:putative beta-1,6-glucan biosynthesis protein (Knh1) [Aspergillus undulatus]|uniref:putative beta-1,6-glucan biosynthesis protein (Knh1) n=1 Tax=Aspergillus undulatus TaxID=1810928 RepID=UPI003CCD1120